MMRDLMVSLIHNFGVMVLKPYLFSILNVLYRLNGMDIIVSPYVMSRKNINPERIKERFRDTIHELYIFRSTNKKKRNITLLKVEDIKLKFVFSTL